MGSEQHLTLGDTMSRAKRKAKYQRQLQQDNTINFNQALKRKHIELRPKSPNQEKTYTKPTRYTHEYHCGDWTCRYW